MKKKKKKLSLLDAYKRVRKGWGAINPITKIIPNKKNKSRAQNKRDFKRQVKDEI